MLYMQFIILKTDALNKFLSLKAQRQLAQMQISVSTTATLAKMDQLAQCHDVQVKEWKKSIESTLQG